MEHNRKTIAVHDGKYHWDDCLAVALIHYIPGYEDCYVIRTRDRTALASADMRVDVGDEYSHERLTYDHHQRGFAEFFNELSSKENICMCGCTLIYRHYGKDILKKIIATNFSEKIDDKDLDWLYAYVYERYLMGVDGNDNGVERYKIDPVPENPIYKVKKVYPVPGDIVSRLELIKPGWRKMEELRSTLTSDEMKNYELQKFLEASTLAGKEFISFVIHTYENTLYARRLTYEKFSPFIKERCRVIALNEKVIFPYASFLNELEKENGVAYEGNGSIEDAKKSAAPLFIILEGMSNDYRICTIPIAQGSFTARLFLHPEWRGLRDTDLEKASGIKNTVFVHKSGFLGVTKTFEAAQALVEKTLQYYGI